MNRILGPGLLVTAVALTAFAEPEVTLRMTVGDESFFDPQVLPSATSYAADYGESITIGYEIENTGDVTLNTHDLVDSEIGTILSGFSLELVPSASVWLLDQTTITEAANIQATWTAYNAGMTDVAVDNDIIRVTLNQGMLDLEVTVGPIIHFTDQTLPPNDVYLAAQDEPIAVGISVTNTGESTLRLHDLTDTVLGTVLSNFSFELVPTGNVFIVSESVASSDLIFETRWAGREAVDAPETHATDTAYVFIDDPIHSADTDASSTINLSELLRVIQFYNSTGFGCMVGTEDGYSPDGTDQTCSPHDSDYAPQDWAVTLSELLRAIQFYNSGAYHFCPTLLTEDSFCPGLPTP